MSHFFFFFTMPSVSNHTSSSHFPMPYSSFSGQLGVNIVKTSLSNRWKGMRIVILKSTKQQRKTHMNFVILKSSCFMAQAKKTTKNK